MPNLTFLLSVSSKFSPPLILTPDPMPLPLPPDPHKPSGLRSCFLSFSGAFPCPVIILCDPDLPGLYRPLLPLLQCGHPSARKERHSRSWVRGLTPLLILTSRSHCSCGLLLFPHFYQVGSQDLHASLGPRNCRETRFTPRSYLNSGTTAI